MAKKQRKVIPDGIVARGEVTGHAHRIEGGVVYEEDALIHVSVEEGTHLTHEEHNPISFQPGDWTTGVKQEYDHFAEEARQVAD